MYKDQILETIEKNPVTVIVAETGAGKSTRVPQFLLEATEYEIVVTQPRRVAAKSVAKRVAQEMDCRFGGLVGFRTAVDRNDSVETRCLFATDGLQLVRELTSAKQTIGNGVVLIVDEVHEWNQNIETLVAWVKKAISEGTDTKVVLMSATLDHEKLSAFFNNAPVIEVPGRCFPVVGSPSHTAGIVQKNPSYMIDEIKRLVTQGSNTLVFLPGKGEITQMQKALEEAKLQAVILPLHGEIEPVDQDRVFNSYNFPKIVLSTNIAQTSVTISDIDAVVDSGLERRIELVNNVETLTLANISQADCLQRAGRAGRVKEGEYVLCNKDSYSYFAKYPTPEILRTLLDQMVLRLASADLDATVLPFYHQPDPSVLKEAKETLIAIEALDANGKITKLGHKINKFPTEVKAAAMILEAIERKCLLPIITIAAILGTQSDTLRRRKKDDDSADFKGWENLIDPDKKYQSDLLVELELFWKAKEFRPYELAKNGIMPKAYGQASEIRNQLKEVLQGLGYNINEYNQNIENEEAILKCVAAGMVVHLYRHSGGGIYRNGDSRQLAKESIINRLNNYPEWIVGKPMNISFTNRRGRKQTIELVSSVTAVKSEWMAEIAPHLVTKKVERLYWSSEQKAVVEDHVTIFNGQEIARVAKPASWNNGAFEVFVNQMTSPYNGSDTTNELYRLNIETLNQYNAYYVRSGGTIPKKDSAIIREQYVKVLEHKKILNFDQLQSIFDEKLKTDLIVTLPQLISIETIASIEASNPLMIDIDGKEFSVSYENDWREGFRAKIEVTEDLVSETKLEAILLPGGRELKLSYSGYIQTLGEHRASIEKARLEELARAERDMVSNFKSQIAGTLTIPQEQPFYYYGATELGQVLQNRLNDLQTEMINGLTIENSVEKVEAVKVKAEETKAQLRAEYEKAQALVTSTEESFEETLNQVDGNFVVNEEVQVQNFLAKAKTYLQEGELTEVENKCNEAQVLISDLKNLVEIYREERDLLIKKSNVPEYLLSAFSEDLDRTLQFVSNVEKIETYRLDSHEITCGRGRARQNMEDAWSAMGESSDFFCGSDPNDVKHYVYEYHFGGGLQEEDRNETPTSRGESEGSFAELLRKAGLK